MLKIVRKISDLIVVAAVLAATGGRVMAEDRAAMPAGAGDGRVDATTLDGKVMCGYQGWFGAEGDGENAEWKWRHWKKHDGAFADGNAKVDLWPDVSELGPDERFATGFKLADGRAAEVFSSFKQATVLRHFQWMK